MGDEQVEVAVGVEDHTVCARRPAAVHAVARHDGELVPGARGGEVEPFVVVVAVGVVVWFVCDEYLLCVSETKRAKWGGMGMGIGVLVTVVVVMGGEGETH